MLIDRRDLITKTFAMTAVGIGHRNAWASSNNLNFPKAAELIKNYVADGRYAGVAAAISSGTTATSFLNAGSLTFESQEPVTSDTLFRIYSVTKVFTAVLTLMLVEDRLLHLDQPLADILPEFRGMRVALNPKESLASRPTDAPITIEQLLTHRSGLSNWQPFLGDNPISNAYRQKGLTPGAYGLHKRRTGYGAQVRGIKALVSELARLPLIAEPGTAWNYSIGYDVLGAVIGRVTGKDFAEVMEQRLLKPLKMTSTGFQVPQSQTFRLSTLYGRTGNETYVIDEGKNSDFSRDPSLIAGGGGLVSTARDMTHFAQMLLDDGFFQGNKITEANTVEQAIQLFSGQPNMLSRDLDRDAKQEQLAVPSAAKRPVVLSAVGASSTMLHVDQERSMFAVFLAQLNLTGTPAAATTYRPELLNAIEADQNE